ncbi:HMA2 domain-containing protein [Vitiosangium sp. GDMCC 1.1324]|uniref:HMA2 domain-containing protein n=1 Tax=Vitiosangium sp. (strain GDMCC 1.1324) TaxID=2138576 RepID=UPI000D3BE6FF|nr:heavy-metal-associated domain-containing protein [Vitiosangium sp. GDMCC 1.1324]PTL81736.1 hypothetical protein DAT35_22615 [Vitiosangium sp. GDMCC 1.1324]
MLPRIIYLAHSSPGRTRLRLPWLRQDSKLATTVADAVERLPGVEMVEVKPYTGSVLCTYDPGELQEETLLEELRRVTGVELVVRPGESVPGEEEELLKAIDGGSNLAVEASRFFKGVNLDMLRATGGHMDLPTLATFGFVTAGAVEVLTTKKLPMPPWFNLAWWAFRTFTTMEKKAIENTEAPLRPGDGTRRPESHRDNDKAPRPEPRS